jgi:hypothetical protein
MSVKSFSGSLTIWRRIPVNSAGVTLPLLMGSSSSGIFQILINWELIYRILLVFWLNAIQANGKDPEKITDKWSANGV